MKRNLIFSVSILSCFLYASSALADDPCKVTLCLWGKMNGSSRDGCSDAEKTFLIL
ncbi:hypothetical protein ACFQUX_02375 [Pantoea stewartii]